MKKVKFVHNMNVLQCKRQRHKTEKKKYILKMLRETDLPIIFAPAILYSTYWVHCIPSVPGIY